MFIHNIGQSNTYIHTVRSARVLTAHNRSQHIQANTIRGFIQSVLLTMGIMMPATCWVNLLWINIYTCVICWFFLLLRRTKFIIRRVPLTGTFVTPLSCLNHLSSSSSTSLRSCFRNRFILNPFCSNALTNLVMFLQIIWIVEFTRPNSRHTSALFFPFSMCRVTLSFPSTLKTFLLFVTVAMLLGYQPPLNCRSRHVGGNFTHCVNYRYYCHLPGLVFM